MLFEPLGWCYPLFLLLALCTAIETVSPCPTSCHCESTHVNCSHASLRSIPRHLPATTQSLDIRHNAITRLNAAHLATLPELRQLDLSYNRIETLHPLIAYNLTSLHKLDVSWNRLRAVDAANLLESLPQLETLSLRGNLLRSADFNVSISRHHPLQSLCLASNRLTELSGFVAVNALTTLDVSDNLITEVTADGLAGMSSLQSISIAANPVRRVTVDGLSSLRELDLRNASLSTLSQSITALGKLRTIGLDGNPWQCGCSMRWLPAVLAAGTWHMPAPHRVVCAAPSNLAGAPLVELNPVNFTCTNASIIYHTLQADHLVGASVILDCVASGDPRPTRVWTLPHGQRVTSDVSTSTEHMLGNGSLYIASVSRRSGGPYKCTVNNSLSTDSVTIVLTLDYAPLRRAVLAGMLVGIATAAGLLIFGLIICAVQRCPSRRRNMAQALSAFKTTQLGRLRASAPAAAVATAMALLERTRAQYACGVACIRANCAAQLARCHARCHASQAMRDAYTARVASRVRAYAHAQLERLREQYKAQQQYLLKLLEAADLSGCLRGAVEAECRRAQSTLFDDPDFNIDILPTDDQVTLQTSHDVSHTPTTPTEQSQQICSPDEQTDDCTPPFQTPPLSMLKPHALQQTALQATLQTSLSIDSENEAYLTANSDVSSLADDHQEELQTDQRSEPHTPLHHYHHVRQPLSPLALYDQHYSSQPLLNTHGAAPWRQAWSSADDNRPDIVSSRSAGFGLNNLPAANSLNDLSQSHV